MTKKIAVLPGDGIGPEIVDQAVKVLKDGVSAAPALRNYLQVLGNVNRELAAMADEVVEVVVGIPVYLKGDSARENSICF